MFLGVDVGGTFTDAVVVDNKRILKQVKVKTNSENVLQGILTALDRILENCELDLLERVVVSSTVVTNALIVGDTEEVFLAVMPGTGMDITNSFPVAPFIVEGYVNHHGKVTKNVELNYLAAQAQAKGKRVAAISGKFSVRNQSNEVALRQELSELDFEQFFLGSEMSGELNFVRRTNSAYFSAAIYQKYAHFIHQIVTSIRSRGINVPIHILKADGGTMPIEVALQHPVEAIFTGPAASVLGIEALSLPEGQAISLDVGGTTTDIAFWENGRPLLANKGARINGFPTTVRAYHMRSVPIGGDSLLQRQGDAYLVGPKRVDVAAALGGNKATLGDALIVLSVVSFGDIEKAKNALIKLCYDGEDHLVVAMRFVEVAVSVLEQTIKEMIQEWEVKPVYTVNDMISGTSFRPEILVGVGGGATGLVQRLALKMNLPVSVPPGAMVANAVGAALARPTLIGTLRADSQEGYYIIPEGGIREDLSCQATRSELEDILRSWLLSEAQRWHLPVAGVEVIACEEFTTIQNYYSIGKIVYLKMQLAPGIIYGVQGQEVSF